MQYKIFWCKVNKYFAEKWLNSKELKDKTWVFVATCVVTDNAKTKWIKFIINEIKKLKKWKIYLTWCWVLKKWKINKDFYKIYTELSKFKDKIVLLKENSKNIFQKNIYTRKNIMIQNWCDNNCTFCMTILARWKHKSRDSKSIIEEIYNFEKNWWKEIVITWINIWAYWCDNTRNFKNSKFANLLKKILEKTNIPRIRISSIWIEYINKNLIKLFENTRINPHFHLSIQSWSDKILKLMNRNYLRKNITEVLKKLNSLKRDDSVFISIGADIIVWFPGEEEKDFNYSLDFIKKFNITKAHIFPFSSHKKYSTVPASRLPNQINENLKLKRVQKLKKESDLIRSQFIQKNKWKILNILIEKLKWKTFSWWSENYIELNESNFKPLTWEKIKVWEIIKWIFI